MFIVIYQQSAALIVTAKASPSCADHCIFSDSGRVCYTLVSFKTICGNQFLKTCKNKTCKKSDCINANVIRCDHFSFQYQEDVELIVVIWYARYN